MIIFEIPDFFIVCEIFVNHTTVVCYFFFDFHIGVIIIHLLIKKRVVLISQESRL